MDLKLLTDLDWQGVVEHPALAANGHLRRYARGRALRVLQFDENFVLVHGYSGLAFFRWGDDEPVWEIDSPGQAAAVGWVSAKYQDSGIRNWGRPKESGQPFDGSEGMALVAAMACDATLSIWDLESGELRCEMDTGHGEVVGVSILVAERRDYGRIMTAGQDGILRWWNMDGELVDDTHTDVGEIVAMAISPTGERVLLGGRTGRIQLFHQGKQGRVLETDNERITALCVTDSGLCVSSALDGTIRCHLEEEEGAKTTWSSCVIANDIAHALVIDDAENLLVWARRDGEVCVVDIGNRESGILGQESGIRNQETTSLIPHPVTRIHHSVSDLAFCPTTTLMAFICEDGSIRLWDTVSGMEADRVTAYNPPVKGIAVSSGSPLVAASMGNTMRVWGPEGRETFWHQHTKGVQNIAFSSDGRSIVFDEELHSVYQWKLGESKAEELMQGFQLHIRGNPISPDGRLLAVAEGKKVHLLDMETKSSVAELGASHLVTVMSFSPDSSRLICGCENGSVECWQVSHAETSPGLFPRSFSRQPPHSSAQLARLWLATIDEKINDIAWHPMSHELIAGCNDGTVYVLNASGEPAYSWHAHDDWIESVAFVNEALIVTSGWEGSVKLWECGSVAVNECVVMGGLDHTCWRHSGRIQLCMAGNVGTFVTDGLQVRTGSGSRPC